MGGERGQAHGPYQEMLLEIASGNAYTCQDVAAQFRTLEVPGQGNSRLKVW